jgi:hypothetical protein
MIEELRAGKPNYNLMGAGVATSMRQELPQLQAMLTKMGALQSVVFKGVGPRAWIFTRLTLPTERWSLESASAAMAKSRTHAPLL